MGRLTDREMLAIAYGALATTTDENLNMVHDLVRDHLFPEPPSVPVPKDTLKRNEAGQIVYGGSNEQ